MSNDKQTITESTKVENTTRTHGTKFGEYDTHTGLSPDAHVGRYISAPPNVLSDDQEQREIEADSFFANTESYIILEGMDLLSPIMDKDRKTIEDFNKELIKEGVLYQIRYDHKIAVRGVTYHYFGAYIYKRADIVIYPDAGFIPPDLPKREGHHACQVCQKYIQNKNVDNHYGTKTHKVNQIRREDLEKKPRTERKTVYHQKHNSHLWRELLGEEHFRIFGQPPKLQLPTNIRYRHVGRGDDKTNHLIIPNNVYIMAEIRELFKNSLIFKLA